MSPPERLNAELMKAPSPLIRGVFYWTITESYAGPYQIGSVEWPVGAGNEPVVVALDGQRFRIDDCIAQLTCDDPQQRLYAACFLEALGAKRAIEPLSKLLSDHDRHVRRQAAKSIAEIARGWARNVAPSMTQGATLDNQAQPAPDADVVLETLIHSLNDVDPATCTYAARALGCFGDHRAVDALIHTLKTGHDSLRAAAAWALGKIGDQRAIEPLIDALQDSARDVRSCSVVALRWFAAPEAVGPLIALLLNPHESLDVLSKVIDTLSEIGGVQAVPALLSRFDLAYPKPGLHYEIAQALGTIGDQRIVPDLIHIVEDETSPGRSGAAMTLGLLQAHAAVESLLKFTTAPLEVAAAMIEALDMIGDRRAVDPLLVCLGNPDSPVRAYAAGALGTLGDSRALEPLLQALRDPSVRKEATIALGELGDQRAIESLIGVLQTDEDADIRFCAVCALGALRDDQALPALQYTVEHDTGRLDGRLSIREAAIEAIEQIKHQRAE